MFKQTLGGPQYLRFVRLISCRLFIVGGALPLHIAIGAATDAFAGFMIFNDDTDNEHNGNQKPKSD